MPQPTDPYEDNPFADPEVQEYMRANNIVHTPGSAQDIMDEAAPLLAAEGFDINDPASFDDLDAFNEALQRAIEQLNFRRFVPVGEPLHYALSLLRLLSESVADESWRLWQALIDSIPPEPESPERASVAHVIGVSLSRLDTWFGDSELAREMNNATVPKGKSLAHDAAVDTMALGRKGRAFDSLDALIIRYRGLALLEGASLAVAYCVLAWAKATDTPVINAIPLLLSETDTAGEDPA